MAPDAFLSAADRDVVQKAGWARHLDLRGAAEMFCRLSVAAGASAGRGEGHLPDVVRLDQADVMLHACCSATDRDCPWATQDGAGQRGALPVHRGVSVPLVKPRRDEWQEAVGEGPKETASLDEQALDLPGPLALLDELAWAQLCLPEPSAWLPEPVLRALVPPARPETVRQKWTA